MKANKERLRGNIRRRKKQLDSALAQAVSASTAHAMLLYAERLDKAYASLRHSLNRLVAATGREAP
jgi:predicted outer membrane protein